MNTTIDSINTNDTLTVAIDSMRKNENPSFQQRKSLAQRTHKEGRASQHRRWIAEGSPKKQ